jgi:ABC-type glutathione transport system ATPase component
MNARRLRQVRGDQVSMVFQTAQNSLNPLKRVGSQVLDLARSHGHKDSKAVLREAAGLCARMSLNADRVLTSYQHELSGGMRQRVGIMLALVLKPAVVLLDEPTTALDVLSQSEVLQILRDLQRERRFSAVLITHDMGVVAELADRVAVMYAGRVVERGRTQQVLINPMHPYTRALIASIPRLTGDPSHARALPGLPPALTTIPGRLRLPVSLPVPSPSPIPKYRNCGTWMAITGWHVISPDNSMIEAINLTKTFAARGGGLLPGEIVRALRGVSVSVPDSGALALIGESGCGKTTLGRILCGLEPYDGEI